MFRQFLRPPQADDKKPVPEPLHRIDVGPVSERRVGLPTALRPHGPMGRATRKGARGSRFLTCASASLRLCVQFVSMGRVPLGVLGVMAAPPKGPISRPAPPSCDPSRPR